MTTKLTTGALSCAPDHPFRNPALLSWESWTSNLRLCSAHLKHGKEHLVVGSLAKLAEDKEHILANWPSATDVKKEAFANRVSDFATSPTIPLSKCAKLVVQGVLEAKFEAVESAKQIHKKTM